MDIVCLLILIKYWFSISVLLSFRLVKLMLTYSNAASADVSPDKTSIERPTDASASDRKIPVDLN